MELNQVIIFYFEFASSINLSEGIAGLVTKAERGRKAKLNVATDSEPIVAAVKANRQGWLTDKAGFEAVGGNKVSREKLHRFFKTLAEDIKA